MAEHDESSPDRYLRERIEKIGQLIREYRIIRLREAEKAPSRIKFEDLASDALSGKTTGSEHLSDVICALGRELDQSGGKPLLIQVAAGIREQFGFDECQTFVGRMGSADLL